MSDDAVPHADVLNSTAQGQIKSIIDRVERLEIEKAEIMDQIKEVYAEGKGNGFDVKILKRVIRLRKQDRAKRQEEDAITDLYLSALGELPLFSGAAQPSAGARADAAADDEDEGGGIATVTLTMSDGSSASGTPDQIAVATAMVKGVSEPQALYDQAVAIVLRDRKASAAYIQRRLQLGYNKAANLLELMQQNGVVGPPDRTGRREILQTQAAA